MKINILAKGILLVASISIFNAFSQNCGKQSLCKPEKTDGYDYSAQSRYATLSTGEKSRLYIATYASCAYKITVCSEESLGKISYKLYERVREKKKVITNIVKGDPPLIVDENGNQSYGEAPVIDTVYDIQVSIKEVEIYDSSKGALTYELKKADKSKNLVLELNVPKCDQALEGCVNLLVGTKHHKRLSGKLITE
ncbi:MAG: hypothetical protein ACOYO1_14620 [Bacteroidales bacterium]